MPLETSLIPRAKLFGNPAFKRPRISPDGKLLGFLAPSQDDVMNVWVAPIDKEAEHPLNTKDAICVTNDKERPIGKFYFQPKSNGILHLQDNGDEDTHLFQTPLLHSDKGLKGGECRDLTPGTYINAEILSEGLLLAGTRPNEVLVEQTNEQGRYDVHRIDLDSGKHTLAAKNPGDVLNWLADNDLYVRGARVMRTNDAGITVRVRKPGDDEEWKVLTEASPGERVSLEGFDEHGRLLVNSQQHSNTASLLAYDTTPLEHGILPNHEVLANDETFDIKDVTQNPKKHFVEAVNLERERRDRMNIAREVQGDYDTLNKMCKGNKWTISSRDESDKNWIIYERGDQEPGKYHLYNRDTRTAKHLSSKRPELEPYKDKLSKMEPITYETKDGLTIHAYLSLPPNYDPSRDSMVIKPHGGPYSRNVWGFSSENQWLTSRRIGVIQPNFRASTGYGKAHYNAGDREIGGKMDDDLCDGLEWAKREKHANPERIGGIGSSFGAFMILSIMTKRPGTLACGVDIAGPTHLPTLISGFPKKWSAMKADAYRRVGHPVDDRELLESRSPLGKEIHDPLLVIQPGRDTRVNKLEQAKRIVDETRARGKSVDYIVFQDEGHDIVKPENKMKLYAHVEAFFGKNLGSAVEPATEEESVTALLC